MQECQGKDTLLHQLQHVADVHGIVPGIVACAQQAGWTAGRVRSRQGVKQAGCVASIVHSRQGAQLAGMCA